MAEEALNKILLSLPANVSTLISIAEKDFRSFQNGNIILRLVVTLLNETDQRISNLVEN